MTLFALLVTLALERLLKMGQHWRISYLFSCAFQRIQQPTLTKTLLLALLWLAILLAIFIQLDNFFFNLPLLLFTIAIGWLCIGAGVTRRHYRDYLKAASANDSHAMEQISQELVFIYGFPADDQQAQLRELQNTLIWINYRYYLAPIILFVAFGQLSAIPLAIYALFRSYQTWLARNKGREARTQSGVDKILHWLDWIPVRLVALAYVFFGNGTQALPTLKRALSDTKTSQYEILTQLAQLSLQDQPHNDPVKTPIAAVTLAKKVSTAVIVILSLLTIYGAVM